ncbi:MAG: hypothetical protein NXY57DRAFT_342450 [Lentinula lateritia]|nr:MAG: hypothetical protein NXY57DRAFT_342450 [Lentinula lateritia]
MIFKQLLQTEAIDVCQIHVGWRASVSSILLLLSTYGLCLAVEHILTLPRGMVFIFGVPACAHAEGVGLCEYVVHLSLID